MNTSLRSILRVVLSATTLLALYNLGPAPIRGDRYNIAPHTNLQKQDEKTLEQEQSHQVQMGQVGSQVAAHVDKPMDMDTGEGNGNSVLSAASHKGTDSNAAANQVLTAANSRLQTEGSSHSWLWAILLVGAALAVVFGIKRWADNNVPDPPTITPKKNGGW